MQKSQQKSQQKSRQESRQKSQQYSKKVNRETANLREPKKKEKILRRCELLKQPGAILQHIVSFLKWQEVIHLQKTCEYFRRRYLELLKIEGSDRRIKANVSEIPEYRIFGAVSIEKYTHIRRMVLGSEDTTLLKDMAKKQTHPKLKLRIDECRDLETLGTLKLHKLVLTSWVPIGKIEPVFETLKYLESLDTEYGKIDEKDLDILKKSQLESFDAPQSLADISKLIHIPELNLGITEIEDVSAIGNVLSKVRKLDISKSRVKDISMLGNLDELNISHLPVTDVSMLGRIRVLDISHTNVKDVSALGHVHVLDISHTPVIDVSKLGHVHTLNISYTKVTDVSVLGNVHKLVFCGIDPHTDISALNHVHTLDLSQSKIKDLGTLSKNPNMFAHIHTLNLSFTEVKDVRRLKHVRELYLVHCSNIEDVSALTHVRKLDISHVKHVNGLKRLKRIKKLTIMYSTVSLEGLKAKTLILEGSERNQKMLRKLGWIPTRSRYESIQRWMR